MFLFRYLLKIVIIKAFKYQVSQSAEHKICKNFWLVQQTFSLKLLVLQQSNYKKDIYKNILLIILYLKLAWYPNSAKFRHCKHWYCMIYHFQELLCINRQFLSFFTELWQSYVITNTLIEIFTLLSSRFCWWSHINYIVAFCVDELSRLTSMQCCYHVILSVQQSREKCLAVYHFPEVEFTKNECEGFVPYLVSYKLERWVHL